MIDTNTIGQFHRGAVDTERAAAIEQFAKSGTDRRKVYDALAEAAGSGYTDYELAIVTGLRQYTAAPRRNELFKAGLVRDSGMRRPTDSGSMAVVWVVSDGQD